MYKCKICGKEYENRFQFLGHCSSHNRTKRVKKTKNVEKKTHKCKFCGKEFDTGQQLGGHTVFCKQNPKREETRKKMSEYAKKYNSMYSLKSRKKVSETIKEKVKNGTGHYSFSKTKTYLFNSKFAGNVRLYGTGELNYAKYLDENNINGRRPKESFHYEYKNKNKRYTPDFYLINENLYVEIKGYETEKDRAKGKGFPLNLKVIKGKELRKLNIIK